MKSIHRMTTLLLVCLMALGLSACKALPSKGEQFTALVRGNLDELYLGRANSDYLKFTDRTAEEVTAGYESSLQEEALFLCGYFSIVDPSDEIQAEAVALCRDIYTNASYTVGKAVRVDGKTYTVPVTVQPLNIIQDVIKDHDDAMAGFFEKYADVSREDLQGEALAAYDADWAHAVLNMVRAQLSHVTYRDTETVDVHVTQTEDGAWQMDAQDLQTLDALILYYPSGEDETEPPA